MLLWGLKKHKDKKKINDVKVMEVLFGYQNEKLSLNVNGNVVAILYNARIVVFIDATCEFVFTCNY